MLNKLIQMEFNLFNKSNYELDEAVYGQNPVRKIFDIANSDNNIEVKVLGDSIVEDGDNEQTVFERQIKIQNETLNADSVEKSKTKSKSFKEDNIVETILSEHGITINCDTKEIIEKICQPVRLISEQLKTTIGSTDGKSSEKPLIAPQKKEGLLVGLKLFNTENIKDPMADIKIMLRKSPEDTFDIGITTVLDYMFPMSSLSRAESELYYLNVTIVSYFVKMCVGLETLMSEIKLINLIRVISLIVYEKITDMLKSRFKSDNLDEIMSKFQMSKKRFFLLYYVLAAQIVEIFLKNYFSNAKQVLSPKKLTTMSVDELVKPRLESLLKITNHESSSQKFTQVSSSTQSLKQDSVRENLKRIISEKPVNIENFIIENDSNRNFKKRRVLLDFLNRH
jgi:hypothetical protein